MGTLGTVQVVDLGVNNLGSVRSALLELNFEVIVATESSMLRPGLRTILPGTGHFSAASKALDELGFRKSLRELTSLSTPLLGICLGAQLLLDASDEGAGEGLRLISGRSSLLSAEEKESVPVLGWRKVYFGDWVQGLDAGWFYFAHSYEMIPSEASTVKASYARGASEIASVVSPNEAVVGLQFHPEKSGPVGLKLLRRVLEGFGV